MTIALYIDEHVPSAITAGLKGRGADVLTVQDDGRSGFDDPDLLNRAAELGLLRLAAAKQRAGEPFAGVIYCHQGAMSVGDCIDQLQSIVEACTVEEIANGVQYLPLR